MSPTSGFYDVDVEDLGENSYWKIDIDIWNRQGERDKDLTLPPEQKVALNSCTPLIVEVLPK